MCTFDLHDEFEGINPDTYGTPNSSLLMKVKKAGFNPVGITVMLCEETFIFKGSKEAEDAAKVFLPEGWWYDFSSWVESRNEYVRNIYHGDEDLAPTVYWLDKNFEPK